MWQLQLPCVSGADRQTGCTQLHPMAETSDGYAALIKWQSENKSVQGEPDIGHAVADQPLEMAVEDEGTINASAGSDQAFMFISDPSELQSLGTGIFCTEQLTDGAVASAGQQQHSELLPILSETDVQTFDRTVEPSDSRTDEQEQFAANTAELSSDASVNNVEKPQSPHPLGSSQNPIRIIQQGNKYTSMQELSQEQLNQIMQVYHFRYC